MADLLKVEVHLALFSFLTCLATETFSLANLNVQGPPEEHLLKYYYFPSPDSGVEIYFNDTESLQLSGLKPATKTIIILDGFRSDLTSYMNTQTKNAFASLPDTNLILVDWNSYNGGQFPVKEAIDVVLSYATAIFAVPTAGEHLAQFFDFLRAHKQIEFSDITILSHSLGCHAASTTGRAVKNMYGSQIGKIVGLDPALQLTEFEEGIRLQVGDAKVVEIYHTSRQSFGDIYPAVGDITIYPNGGERQPCEEDGAPGSTGCNNHSYSWKLYNYALTNTTVKACPCKGAACHCKDCLFECGNDAINIGPYIPEHTRGSYHVNTGYLEWD